MVKCCAPMCVNSTYRKSPDITFHRFPKDEHLKNAWLKSLNRKDWQPNSSCVLCSEHFEGHLLDRSGFRTVLAHGAIPTIFFSPQESKENQQALPTEKTPVKRTARGERSKGGFNDNPNVVQFRYAYKKNLIRLKLKLQKDGFKIPNQILTVSSSKKAVETVNSTTPSYEQNIIDLCNVNEEDVDCFINNVLSTPLDDYTHHVTIYIAGFIARKVLKVVKCSICQMLMLGDKENLLCSLVNKKDRGGLIYPSEGLIKIIQASEKFLKMVKGQINYEYNGLLVHINDYVYSSNILKSHDNDHDLNHLYLIIKIIIKFYVDLRLYNTMRNRVI